MDLGAKAHSPRCSRLSGVSMSFSEPDTATASLSLTDAGQNGASPDAWEEETSAVGQNYSNVSAASTVDALLYDLRQQDFELWRDEREREAELHRLEQAKWEKVLGRLEAELAGKQQMLAQVMEPAAGITTLDPKAPLSAFERELCEERQLADEYCEEATNFHQMAMKASEEVERLEAAVAQESLRTERLRGIALTNQTCCADLEKNVESHRIHTRSLTEQIHTLEHKLRIRQQEMEKEEGMWNHKRAELERVLETVRQRSAESQVEYQRRRHEVLQQREREVRQFRTHTEHQILSAQQASQRHIEAEEAAASKSARRRTPLSNVDSKEAAKIASLRSALHRQEEECKKELREIKSEFFSEQQQLMDHDAAPVRRQRQARLQQLQGDVEDARELFEQQRRQCLDQRQCLHDLEEQLASQSQEARRQVGQLEAEACAGELGQFLDEASSALRGDGDGADSVDSSSPTAWRQQQGQQMAFAPPARTGNLEGVARFSDVVGDDPVVERLREICLDMVHQHESRIQKLHDERHAAVQRLEAELADQRQDNENLFRDRRNGKGGASGKGAGAGGGAGKGLAALTPVLSLASAGASARLRATDGFLAQRVATLRASCEKATEEEHMAWQAAIFRIQEETADDEARYKKLRCALLAEHEQAEVYHQRVRAEQAEQRRLLVEQLAMSGADGGSLMDDPDLLAQLLALDH